MNEEIFDRLKANDPASSSEPDLARIKARVDAHTADNIVPMTPRSGTMRWLRSAAAVGAIALAAGAGYTGGTLHTNGTPESLISSVAPGGALPTTDSGRMGVNGGLGGGGVASADKMMGGWGYGGDTILNPGGSVPNADGTAYSYKYTSDGIDRKALAWKIADVLGITNPAITNVDGTYQANDDKGAYNLYVGNDAQVWFNGYNNAISPWSCEQSLAGGGVSSQDGSPRGGVEITQEMTAQCDAEWTSPSKADAIAAAKAAFAKLGLDGLKGARFVAYGYNPRSMTVSVTSVIDGMDVSSQWSAEVSKGGVFSIGGSAARIVKAESYPTVGARDAALRSALRKWASFGPLPLWQPEQVVSAEASPSANPTTPTHNGKPMVQAYVRQVAVLGAERALMQVWLAGGEVMLMPAWNFTAQDGSIWQMLAVTDEYVDWTQPSYNGPIAYDTLGGDAVAKSGTATSVAPMTK